MGDWMAGNSQVWGAPINSKLSRHKTAIQPLEAIYEAKLTQCSPKIQQPSQNHAALCGGAKTLRQFKRTHNIGRALGVSKLSPHKRRQDVGMIEIGDHVKKVSKRRTHHGDQFAKKLVHVLVNLVSGHDCGHTLAQHFNRWTAVTQCMKK